jgi:hypothetical protein
MITALSRRSARVVSSGLNVNATCRASLVSSNYKDVGYALMLMLSGAL